MAWVALLLLPVALMTFAVRLLIVREVWRRRHERLVFGTFGAAISLPWSDLSLRGSPWGR